MPKRRTLLIAAFLAAATGLVVYRSMGKYTDVGRGPHRRALAAQKSLNQTPEPVVSGEDGGSSKSEIPFH